MVTATNDTTNADLEKKILNQVEYYFSKVNLRRDKFMRNTMSENEGWMPLGSLLTFNRLKELSTDEDFVWKIVKTSEILKTEDDKHKIRPMEDVGEPTDEEKKDFSERTVHLKGFEKDAKREQLQEFCSQLGKVEHLEMRFRFKTREFKGCVHVTYVNKDEAEKILADDELKFGDKLLLKENMEQYAARKQKYHEEKVAKREAKKAAGDEGEQKKEFTKTPGVLLKLTGLEPRAKFSDIKAQLGKNRKVAFVGNINQAGESVVRFSDENGAVQTLEELKEADAEEASFMLGEQKILCVAVSEEEENAFWDDFKNRDQGSNRNKHFGGKRKGAFGRGRGGYKRQRN